MYVRCLLCYKSSFRHQAREAEPKDYDMKEHDPEKRHLHLSTYNRVGNVTDGVSIKNCKKGKGWCTANTDSKV